MKNVKVESESIERYGSSEVEYSSLKLLLKTEFRSIINKY